MAYKSQTLENHKKALFDVMSSESDRGCILVGASVLEELLEDVIRLKMFQDKHVVKHAVDPLFAPMGPLSTFSAKTKLAYSLGLIKKWCFDDLEKIRKIRNGAAHQYSSNSFNNEDIVNITCKLMGADHAVKSFSNKSQETNTSITLPKKNNKGEKANKHPKERVRFIFTVNYIAGLLHGFLEGFEIGVEIIEQTKKNLKDITNPKSLDVNRGT